MSLELWFSLGPLLAFNMVMMVSVIVYGCLEKQIPKDGDVARRSASHLVNRWFREYWAWVIGPVERFCVRAGISPNALSISGVVVSGVGAAVFYATGHLGLAGWCVIFGGTFDWLDGRVARASGRVTREGGYFDAVLDRYGEGIGYMGLLYFYRDHTWMFWIVMTAMMGAYLVSYAKARGEAMGVEVTSGSLQRAERIVYLGVASIFSPVVRLLSARYSPFPDAELLLIASLIFLAVGTNWSAVARIREVMGALRTSRP